jgi:hypothetical protein
MLKLAPGYDHFCKGAAVVHIAKQSALNLCLKQTPVACSRITEFVPGTVKL